AGLIQSEVVLIADKGDGGKRWVYLDVGKFNGLAETIGESIKYRIEAPGRRGPSGPVILAGPTCDSADILYEQTEYRLPLGLAVDRAARAGERVAGGDRRHPEMGDAVAGNVDDPVPGRFGQVIEGRGGGKQGRADRGQSVRGALRRPYRSGKGGGAGPVIDP